MPPTSALPHTQTALRELALSYPETHEDFPWGESAFKVKGKVFLFMHANDERLSLSVKLPDSNTIALTLPFVSPTGYSLGKSGWVTARFEPDEEPPFEMLREWLDESYRAVAPKKLAALLPAAGAVTPAASAPAKPKKPSTKAKPSAKPTRRTVAK